MAVWVVAAQLALVFYFDAIGLIAGFLSVPMLVMMGVDAVRDVEIRFDDAIVSLPTLFGRTALPLVEIARVEVTQVGVEIGLLGGGTHIVVGTAYETNKRCDELASRILLAASRARGAEGSQEGGRVFPEEMVLGAPTHDHVEIGLGQPMIFVVPALWMAMLVCSGFLVNLPDAVMVGAAALMAAALAAVVWGEKTLHLDAQHVELPGRFRIALVDIEKVSRDGSGRVVLHLGGGEERRITVHGYGLADSLANQLGIAVRRARIPAGEAGEEDQEARQRLEQLVRRGREDPETKQ